MSEKENDPKQTGNLENDILLTQRIEQLEAENQRLHIEIDAIKLAREGLRDGQTFLQEVLKSQGETFVFILDENYVINFAFGPERLEKFYNLSFSNYIGKYPDEYLREYPLEVKIETISQVFKTGKIVRKEIEIGIHSGRVWWHIDLSPMKDEDGRIAAVIATIRDITEYKNAEIIIQKERDKAQSYLDLAGVMFVGIDPEGKIRLVNKKGCEVLGYKEDEIIGKNWFQFIPERIRNERISASNKLLSEEIKSIMDNENLILTKDGKEKLIAWHNSVLKNDEGKIIGFLSSGEDITDRNKAEEKLKESEERYRLLYQNINEVIWTYDMNLKCTFMSPSIYNFLGYTVEESLGMSIQELVTSKSFEILTKGISEVLQREMLEDKELTRIGTEELEYIHKDGHIVFGELNAVFIRDSNGKAIGFLGSVRDISERKKAELMLKESEEKFRVISEQNLMAIVIFQDGVVKFSNDAFSTLIEYSQEEIQSWTESSVFQVVHPDDREMVRRQALKKQSGIIEGIINHYKFRFITKSSKIKWVNIFSKSIIYEGKTADFATLIDITNSKETEEILRENEEKYRTVIEKASDGIVIVQDSIIKYINPAMCKMLDYSYEECVGSDYTFTIHPDEMDLVVERHDRRMVGDNVPKVYESAIIDKSGNRIDVEFNISVITYEGGIADLTIIRDITKRKAEEKELKIRNKISNAFLTSTQDEIYSEVLQIILDGFKSEFGFFGYIDEKGACIAPSMTKDVWDECKMSEKTIEFPRETWGGIWGQAMIEKKSKCSNLPFNVPEGHIQIYNALDVPIIYQEELIGNILIGNKSTGYTEEDQRLLKIIVKSIAPILKAKLEHEKAQKKLLYQSMLLENISEAVISTDKEMNILSWNYAAQKIFGWKAEEVIGKNFEQIAQPEFHITSKEKINTYLTNLGFWSGEVINHKRDGTPIYISCSISVLKDDQGNPKGFVRVNSDITKNKIAEKKLKESEKNLKKAQRIAQIGHWNVDLTTKEVSGSNELFRILNLKHDKISLDTFVEVVHPDDREYDLYHIQRGMEYGESWNIEHRLITKDGTEKWVNSRGEAVRDEKGKITMITGTTQDITEQKKLEKSIIEERNRLKTTEEALRESGGIMLAILENSPDYIIMTDREGTIQFINRPFTGMNKGDLHNNKIYDIITPEYHKIVKDRISQMFLYGRAEKVKVNIRDPLGFFTLYEVQFGNIKRDWEIIGVIINFKDITENKNMDKSIKENEEIYRNLFKNSAIGLGIAYTNGEIVDINEACSKITGYTVEDLNEIGPSALYANQEDYQRLLKILQEKGEVNNFVVKFRNIQGNGYWAMISVRSIIYKEKKAFLSSLLDITELIMAKEEIIESE
jgi:PAS domain S-box-containing protein